MKLLLIFLLTSVLSSSIVWGQAKKNPPQKALINEGSIVKDSSGTVLPYVIWKNLLVTGSYILKAVDPQDVGSEFILVRLTEAQKQKNLESSPKPTESKFFITGTRIGNFLAKDMADIKYKIKDLKGKIIVLNFWFINCAPCRAEIPELNKLARDYTDSANIIFLAIALDKKNELEDFLRMSDFNYKIIDDGRYITDQFKLNAYPTNVVIDQEGKIYFHSSGFSYATAYWIRKSITELLAN